MRVRSIVAISLIVIACATANAARSSREDAPEPWLRVEPGADARSAASFLDVEVSPRVAIAASIPGGSMLQVDRALRFVNADGEPHLLVLTLRSPPDASVSAKLRLFSGAESVGVLGPSSPEVGFVVGAGRAVEASLSLTAGEAHAGGATFAISATAYD